GLCPTVQITKLDAQNSGLNCVEPEVAPQDLGVVPLLKAVIPQHPQPLREFRIIGGNHPAITGSSEVLGGIEAETARISESSGTLSANFGANGLRGIFDYRQLVSGSYTKH